MWDDSDTIVGVHIHMMPRNDASTSSGTSFREPVRLSEILELFGRPDELEVGQGFLAQANSNFWIAFGYSFEDFHLMITAKNSINLLDLSYCDLDQVIAQSIVTKVDYTDEQFIVPNSSLIIPGDTNHETEECKSNWKNEIEFIYQAE